MGPSLQASLFQPADLNLSAGDPAVHLYICELLNILCALWGCRNWGDNMFQTQKHGEEQDEENGQESQK